jgi:hypothetical protein
MSVQEIHTESLVALYSMAKMYAEDKSLNRDQDIALKEAESIIQNNSGWEITEPYNNE